MENCIKNDLVDINFFNEFQEFIDSTIQQNNLKLPIEYNTNKNFNSKKLCETSQCLNGDLLVENDFSIQNMEKGFKKMHTPSILEKKKINSKSFKTFHSIFSDKAYNNKKNNQLKYHRKAASPLESFEIEKVKYLEALIKILSELVIKFLKKQNGIKVISSILNSKIMLSNKTIKRALIRVTKKKLKSNKILVREKIKIRKNILMVKKNSPENSKKLDCINFKKCRKNSKISLKNQSSKVEFPNIEDPILFIDNIYNQLLVNNFEIYNDIKPEISKHNNNDKVKPDQSFSNDFILNENNENDTFLRKLADDTKLNNLVKRNEKYNISQNNDINSDFNFITENFTRKEPDKHIAIRFKNCFTVFSSFRSIIFTKNLIIVPLFLIFINSNIRFFSLNLSFSSSKQMLFSAALSSWQLASPSTLETSLAITQSFKSLVNNFV